MTGDDEHDLDLVGFLVFLDQPKALGRGIGRAARRLGIAVKIVTGDNPLVAETVCRTLGLPAGGTLTGAEIDALDDDQLIARRRPRPRSSPG